MKKCDCHTEIKLLGKDGAIDGNAEIFVDIRNHHFKKEGEKEICVKCGLILSKQNF